jgi:hypothetical protein
VAPESVGTAIDLACDWNVKWVFWQTAHVALPTIKRVTGSPKIIPGTKGGVF